MHILLKLLALLLMFSTIPIAFLGVEAVNCEDVYRNYVRCRAFSYPRLGLVIAVFAVGFLLWIVLSQNHYPRDPDDSENRSQA